MRGIIEMFEEKSLGSPEEADKFVAILSRQAKRLDSIINDLLVLSRLEDDEDKHIELICTQIRDAVDLSVQVCKERADLKNIALVCSIDPSLHGLIHPPLFEQALVNLIVNAINYSPEGTLVSITAFRQENLAVVMVKDQGIGIDPKHHARLWERFYRVDKSRHRGSGGTGLGLAIVKHIAMIHGGQIGIESMPGQGSTFKFSVNACHPEPQSEVLAIPGA
jgi:two-component system phosphate regulon sensor histidine kinase PhoR